jgi:hypothetical protein
VEGEELGVVLVKGWVLHVVEDDHIAKNLLNPIGGPSMQRKTLNANFDMKEPIWRMSVGIQTPRVNLEQSGADKERASTDDGVTLLRVVEPGEEVLGLIERDWDIPEREPKLPMQLIGNCRRTDPRGWIKGGDHGCFATQFGELRGHSASGNDRGTVLGWPLRAEPRNGMNVLCH